MAFWPMNNPFGYQRPSRIRDQHFGLVLEPEDLVAPLVSSRVENVMHGPAGYLRPWRSELSERDVGSTISMGDGQFKVNLDVQQFKPEEISVKVSGDDTVTVEGRHEEKQDEHGYISRHFVRRYVLPKDHDINKIESKLSSDGILTVTAPRMAVRGEDAYRSVPISQTGQVFKAVAEAKKAVVEEKKVESSGEKKVESSGEKKVEGSGEKNYPTERKERASTQRDRESR